MAEIVANGIRTHIQRLGSGSPTVVFIHGIVVDNMASLYFTLANAAAGHRQVLLYDLRGHGKSERPAGGYDLDTLLDDLHGVLDACDLAEPVILAGHSYGGLIALAYAVRNPERVSGLVLIDPPLPLEGWGPRIAGVFSVPPEVREQKIQETYDRLHGSADTRKRKRMERTVKALVYETSLLQDMRGSRALTEAELAGVRCPLLALYGDTSEILDCAKQIKELIPHAEIRLFPGCSHRVLLEATQPVREAVLSWLDKQG